MQVLELHESEARRVRLLVDPGLGLQVLPAALGGGQRVVPVADEDGGRLALPCLGGGELLRRQRLHRRGHVLGALRGDGEALHGAGALEEGALVLRRREALGGEQGLDHGLAGVVDDHDDVGQLERGVLADGDARGQPSHDGLLGGPDERGLRAVVVVLVQVDRHDQALAGRHLLGLAVEGQEGRGALAEDAVGDVLLHGLADLLDALGVLGRVRPRD
mmetsp:Transcript_58372/g.166126  ORF Transcript_58372/g.166126 Transcript_58372/m.166126 type:complete len:218 (+) Transcript_58372:1054-1707(+)